MSRLSEMGVVLYGHDSRTPLGRVLKAEIDTTEHKGRATVQFDDDEMSLWYFRKVQAGTLKGVSVGYRVDVWEEVMPNATSTNGRFQGPCDVAVRWTPYEISICPVPADASVGVGRSEEEVPGEPGPVGMRGGAPSPQPSPPGEGVDGLRQQATEATNLEGGGGASPESRGVTMEPKTGEGVQTVDVEQERAAAVEAERTRVSEITTICRDCEMNPDEFISKGTSVDAVRAAALEEMKKKLEPVPQGQRTEVVAEASDKFRAAAPQAMLLRAGLDPTKAGIEKLNPAASEIRHMSLRSLMEEDLRLRGRTDAARLSHEELLRAALSPDSAFGSVLDQTIGHAMLIGHQTADTTFQEWVKIGSNRDFKATPKFRMSEGGTPAEVKQNGEIEMDEMSDESVSTRVRTYAKRWGFTRQALINDDLGVLTDTPSAYARAAMMYVNQCVYAIINTNPAIYDGFSLFDLANHGNLLAGAAPAVASVSLMRAAMAKQTGLRGQALNIRPRFMLTGVDVQTASEQLVASLADPAAANAGVVNPFRTLKVISDAEIADTNSWGLAADPGVADTIEVTTLNGNLAPQIESRVGFEVLGMEWRLYIDFGVTALDYRGLVWNPNVN
jgi:hypothetical protein